MPLDMIKDGHLGGYIRGGDPATWCPHLWSWLIERFGVKSVLDVGCGEGHSTRYFQQKGCRVIGVDGAEQAIADSVIPEHVRRHDFCSGPFDPGEPIDMVWSCEFLEHVEEQYLEHILSTFAHATRVIAVTHAFPHQTDGHHHVNLQPSSYWIRKIEALGFRCDPSISREARRRTLADYFRLNHFGRSGLVFVHESLLTELAVRRRSLINSPSWRGFCINRRFRLSGAYLAHRVRRHRLVRRARALGVDPDELASQE